VLLKEGDSSLQGNFLKASSPESAGQNQSNLVQIILW
jgi:hypothetical protein